MNRRTERPGPPPILNDEGQVALRGFITGPGINGSLNNNKAIWWDRGPGVAPVMYARDTNTGLANGRDAIGFG